MSAHEPVLYFDLASPYAYLAVKRAAAVLGVEPHLQPVLVGAIFHHRGWGSWAATDARDWNIAEVERRARDYGLPLVWPPGWPTNSLVAQRAAIFAAEQGLVREFASEGYRAAFAEGRDLADTEIVLAAAQAAGLDRTAVAAAVAAPRIKLELRRVTDEAIGAGVMGVPSIQVGKQVLWGDDHLEEAAALRAGEASPG
jgi:2-hydroxychromene-2-carboxylate isomerase